MSNSRQADDIALQFESLRYQSGLYIQDPIEKAQLQLFTDTPVDPTPISSEQLVYPVSNAVALTTTQLQREFGKTTWFRDRSGKFIKELKPYDDSIKLSTGDYVIEFGGAPVKLYIEVHDTSLGAMQGKDSTHLTFDPGTTVHIGARSYHSRPAQTLVTTDNPTDLMDAISLLGNAMKTWGPDRTYPTLRGHPPLLELSDTSDLPSDMTPPDTGISLTLPESYEWLYPAVSVAYWLGATVKPGQPALHINGWSTSLGAAAGYTGATDRHAFEKHLRDILQYTFQFDCAVRGFYNKKIDITRKLEAEGISLNTDCLANASLADRVKEYLTLEVPLRRLQEDIKRPDWKLTADVEPNAERAEVVPFLARDLAVIRCSTNSATSQGADLPGQQTTSTQPSRVAASTPADQVLRLPDADSMFQAWVGEGFAVDAIKATTASYLNRIETDIAEDVRIEIDVIVNSDEMVDEASVSEIYGTDNHLDFDINLHRQLSTRELKSILERDTDFIHYIGHVVPQGFDCTDGYLDARQLDHVGTNTFILNACSSYEQGQQLIESGAIAGVVTLADVINPIATKIGRTMAQLLNRGFTIGGATTLIQDTMLSNKPYIVVGDSRTTVAQGEEATPGALEVSRHSDTELEFVNKVFTNNAQQVGSLIIPQLESTTCYIAPVEIGPIIGDTEDLANYIDVTNEPIIAGNEFYWPESASAEQIFQSLQQ